MSLTEKQQVTDNDLANIRKVTLREMQESEVFVFGMKVADAQEKTSNGRVWTREFLEQVQPQMRGLPVLLDHDNRQALKVATVIDSDLREDGLHARAFIPLDDAGKQNREKIENGTFKSVSINAFSSNIKEHDDHVEILTSDDARVYEVSITPVPGCRTCHITETVQTTETAECATTTPDPLREYGKQQHEKLIESYIRHAGFVLGEIDREKYRKVAEATDPITLQGLTDDLRNTYDKQENQGTTVDDINKDLREQIRMKLQVAREVVGKD